MTRHFACILALFGALGASAAHADEVFGGVYAHEVDTPFTLKTYESGTDVQIGYRSDRLESLGAVGSPAAHVFVSVNSAGDTSFAAAGLSWTIGVAAPVYVRPGVGLAVHDAPSQRRDPTGARRTDFGSRVLFEPEIALGIRISERFAVEASWVHISNARLFNHDQNPGLDTMGVRLAVSL